MIPRNSCCEYMVTLLYPKKLAEIYILKYLDGKSAFSAVGRGHPIVTNPLNKPGLNTINGLLEGCSANHSLCLNRNSGKLPLRILDLSADDLSKGIRLQVTEANIMTQHAKSEYLALSYCWGIGRGMPQTTKNTLEAHRQNIAWDSLPKVFQEAMLLTKALGVHYLWADALCIVQDDPADRLRASFEMDNIFGNALLTIAATSAADPTKSLFVPKTQSFKIQATDNKGTLSKIYVREQPPHYSFKAPFVEGAHMNDWELPFNTTQEDNARTPLLRRAWAYIERLLSPRVLHFTESEMILECREAFQCECGRIDDTIFDARMTDSVKREFANATAQRGDNSDGEYVDSLASRLVATSLTADTVAGAAETSNALELWSYIVTEYTARNLTNDEDRLLAIAGVAKSFLAATGSGYIAGHWINNTLGLLWYPNEGTHCRRPRHVSGHNVPTWSWASVEGSPILFDNASAMDLACSVSFPSDQVGLFSPVSGDTAEMRAAMACEVTFHENSLSECFLTRNGISVEFQPDVIPLRGEDAVKAGEMLICVLVSMSFRSSILGLILKKSPNKVSKYRRVGRFECYECLKEESDDDPEDAEALFEHWFPEVDDMTQLDDRPRQTFKIV